MAIATEVIFSGTTYKLMCETVEHSFVRLPTQSGMPAVEGSEPEVLIVDLGVVTQQVTLNGTVNVTSSGSDDPTKQQLETMCLTWWKYGDTPSTMVRLNIPGSSYYVALKTASFRMEGGLENRWAYSLAWLVRLEI